MRLLPFVAVVALLGSACASSSWTVNAQAFKDPGHGGLKQASFDMQCAEHELEAIDLGPGTVGVRGCGKQATYKWVSGAGWVNNSPPG